MDDLVIFSKWKIGGFEKMTVAQLLSEVNSEIFRNQIYFYFFQNKLFESKKKNHWKLDENTMMRSAL